MKPLNTLTLLSAALLLSACGGEGDKTPVSYTHLRAHETDS